MKAAFFRTVLFVLLLAPAAAQAEEIYPLPKQLLGTWGQSAGNIPSSYTFHEDGTIEFNCECSNNKDDEPTAYKTIGRKDNTVYILAYSGMKNPPDVRLVGLERTLAWDFFPEGLIWHNYCYLSLDHWNNFKRMPLSRGIDYGFIPNGPKDCLNNKSTYDYNRWSSP